MKTSTKSLLFSLILVSSSQTLAKDGFTFGLGAGSLYSGIGWVKTDLFDFQTPNHGASIYIGSELDYDGYQAVYGRLTGAMLQVGYQF